MRTACLLTVTRSIPWGWKGGSASGVGLGKALCHVTCDACWEANPPPGQTNTCENITLPQTSFAGGSKPEPSIDQTKTPQYSQGTKITCFHGGICNVIGSSCALTISYKKAFQYGA